MKRIFCAFLALVLAAGMAGCKKEEAETEPPMDSFEEFTEAPIDETEDETEETLWEETETSEETFEESEEPTETTEETVPPCANHTWGYWVQLEAPTTSAEGKRVRTCVVCGTEDVETIAQLPKTTHTHKYKRETSKATCEEDGWVYYYCTCGDWYQVEEKATGHQWGDWKNTTKATETRDAVWTRTCKKCREKETKEVPFCGDGKHKLGAVQTKAATCVKEGEKYQECSVCGCEVTKEVLPATGIHKWGEWTVRTAATVDSEGVLERKCTVCHKVDDKTLSIPKLSK